ncbi:MAG: hypothetical protein PHH08_01155 [Candidatus ainarchaeum sp.]|nr:hypothetical protein [Candidatus ainarchaeum sp.]
MDSKRIQAVFLGALVVICLSNAVFALDLCPKELEFTEEGGKYYWKQTINSGIGTGYASLDHIEYSDYCGMFAVPEKGTITIYAKNSAGTKIPLLKIEMKKYKMDSIAQFSTDNDAWDFEFTLLKPDGSAAAGPMPYEIWEWSNAADAAGKTKLDIKLKTGEPAFNVALVLNSTAGWDAKLETLWVVPKQDLAGLMKKLAEGTAAGGGSTVNGSCSTGPNIDGEITGTSLGGDKFKMCKFSPGDVFGNLYNDAGAKFTEPAIFSISPSINVFAPPKPVQICLKSRNETAVSWSTSKTGASRCYTAGALTEEQKTGLKGAYSDFYNVFPKGVVEKYLKSVFVGTKAQSITGGTADSSFSGLAIEMETFLYSAGESCLNPSAAKETAIHEFTHLMDFHNCFIFGNEDQKTANKQWKFTGSKASDFYAITPYSDYLGSGYATLKKDSSSDKDGFIPAGISTYVRADAGEDLAETTTQMLMNNANTKKISEKAAIDEKLKKKVLLIEKFWSDATGGAMNQEWWCDNITELKVGCQSKPAANINEGIQNVNKRMLKGLGWK